MNWLDRQIRDELIIKYTINEIPCSLEVPESKDEKVQSLSELVGHIYVSPEKLKQYLTE